MLPAFLAAAKQTEIGRAVSKGATRQAERKLRAGKVSEAMNLFEEIIDGHVPPSSSSLFSRICEPARGNRRGGRDRSL